MPLRREPYRATRPPFEQICVEADLWVPSTDLGGWGWGGVGAWVILKAVPPTKFAIEPRRPSIRISTKASSAPSKRSAKTRRQARLRLVCLMVCRNKKASGRRVFA